jgi:deoxycytidine triphosphate deaminase
MKFLRDEELVSLYEKGIITTNTPPPSDWYHKNSPVQPGSLDLSVGWIFSPEKEIELESSYPENPVNNHVIEPGATVLVETEEVLDVPPNSIVIGFPIASISAQGLLMTNPGIVDPGYKGKLTFTIINMGKDSFPLKKGEAIFTTIWMQLDENVKKGYSDRYGEVIREAGLKKKLRHLTKDFMNIDDRAKKHAKSTLMKTIGLASLIALILPPILSSFMGQMSSIEAKLSDQSQVDNQLSDRLSRIEGMLEMGLQNNLGNRVDRE